MQRSRQGRARSPAAAAVKRVPFACTQYVVSGFSRTVTRSAGLQDSFAVATSALTVRIAICILIVNTDDTVCSCRKNTPGARL